MHPAGTERVAALATEPLPMCAAKPAAALRRWSPVRTCASRSSAIVHDRHGEIRFVCKIHEKVWNEGDQLDLSQKWGWL